MTTANDDRVPRTARGILTGDLRGTTIGLLLVVTLIAYEAIAVATALPRAVSDLHGLAYYGWAFTAFLVANVVGIVVGGELCDRVGPKRPVLLGLLVFVVGLVIAGTAVDMAVFVLGRGVQGVSSGMVVVAIYVIIGDAYAPALRPTMFGALSAAWVIPSLVGPFASGVLTERFTWRLVFLLIPPLVAIGLVLILPALQRLQTHTRDSGTPGERRWPFAVVAAVGISLLQYAGQRPGWLALVPLGAGLALLGPALTRLLPAGTLRARRGLPTVILLRGLVAGAFFGVDAFVPLTLTQVHGYSPTAAGIPLMVGSVGWSSASWWQGRHPDVARSSLIRVGFVLVTTAAVAMAVVAFPDMPGWLAYPVWVIGGLGMGLVMPSVAVLTLDLSPLQTRGANSSALQVMDVMTAAICIGIGGALVAVSVDGDLSLSIAISTIGLSMGGVAVVGATLAGRVRALTS